MKNENVFIVIIVMVGLIACAWLLADGMKSLGHSIEGAGLSVGQGLSTSDNKKIKVDLGVSSGKAGSSETFRIETITKQPAEK